jgi:hypothetical protein
LKTLGLVSKGMTLVNFLSPQSIENRVSGKAKSEGKGFDRNHSFPIK